jgi:hypothetical protein
MQHPPASDYLATFMQVSLTVVFATRGPMQVTLAAVFVTRGQTLTEECKIIIHGGVTLQANNVLTDVSQCS